MVILLVVIVFDIDGVLINSYNGIEIFYREDLPQIIDLKRDYIDYLLYLEILGEAIGWLREDWWFKYIPGLTTSLYDKLITRYWERRIEYQKLMPGVKKILSMFRDSGVKLYSVSYRDDIYGLKRYRIEIEGLNKYFEEIIIAGEDVPTRVDGLKTILDKIDDEIIYVDDKPLNLYYITTIYGDRVKCIHYGFKYGKYLFPWINPGNLFITINNLYQLYRMVVKQYLK